MEKSVFRPISTHPIPLPSKKVSANQQTSKQGFAQHLRTAVDEKASKLVISKHAQLRLSQRNIEINDNTWSRIEKKVSEAKKMGVKDSLVILHDAALVVSAKNHTVITAMDRNEAASQIFTNINGTIILD
ncbi:TIGR02530 family flagellar biosynthesis protein [Peribacillus sp. SCS-155]|uniref:TIGR02530 family flagellar biosynthesis protein n=1 Tax=Peribacillus sedimenti TaxID=3115297 RepID=UPI003905FAA2